MTNLDRGPGLSFLLGAEYERKKQKLQKELQLDYKRYVDQKRDLKAQEYNKSQPHGLSLPIAERTSVKEKLREERHREYNLFLQEQAKTKRSGQGEPSLTSKPKEPPDLDAEYRYSPDHNTSTTYTEHPTSRRDAATLTDTIENKKGRKTWDLGHQRRRALLSRQESYDSFDDKFSMDTEEELEFSHKRKPNGQTHKSKYIRDKKERRAKRAPLDIKHTEVFTDENNNDQNWNSEARHIQDKGKMAERSRPAAKNNPVFATGLLIGQTEEQEALQMKKERYKQALLNQIAEQQENKRKEKILELNVAASGATYPHKPDRFRQFGSVYHNNEKWKQGVSHKPESGDHAATGNPELKHFPDSNISGWMERREPPGRTRSAFPSPPPNNNSTLMQAQRRTHKVYSPDIDIDEYHKDFSHVIGEVTTKGISDVPPPLPPRVGNTYKTPYDDAYYYYGSRHPLEPMLSYNQSDRKYEPEGAQESETRTFAQQRRAVHRPTGPTQPDYGQKTTVIPLRQVSAESEKQRRENAFNYQEALKQQIKDREEHRRREKEERELYDAKKEAEMMSYNPWGRGGGGAPIKDQRGNLITDLDQMHRTNEDTYRNPLGNNMSQSFGSSDGGTPRANNMTPLPGLGQRGYKKPEHLQQQDRYKEALIKQMEENRRKQAEEREQRRKVEEKEEKRLAEERAHILKAYEEEQRKQKKMQNKVDHELQAYEWKEKTKDKLDKGKKRPEIKEEKDRPQTRERATKTTHETWEKSVPSPPVPALQHKLTNTNAPRPPSVMSQLSSKTECLDSVPHSHQGPVQQQQQQQQQQEAFPDDQQEVISELSALRRYLRKEQKQLEAQIMRTDPVDEHYLSLTRQRQVRGDAAELRHKKNVLPPTQKLHSTQDNMQNIREFNQLKYRDTSSREEVLYNYPDPPSDPQSLDIQQQALLREQQRTLQRMKSGDTNDLPLYRNKSRNSILPSETAFLDVYCDEDFIHQPSTESHQRSSHHGRHNYDGEAVPVDQMDECQPDAPPRSSNSIVNLDAQVRHSRRHKYPSEIQPGDEGDFLSSALERPVSVETVATEPWLQTGTSEAEHLDYRGPGRRPQARS